MLNHYSQTLIHIQHTSSQLRHLIVTSIYINSHPWMQQICKLAYTHISYTKSSEGTVKKFEISKISKADTRLWSALKEERKTGETSRGKDREILMWTGSCDQSLMWYQFYKNTIKTCINWQETANIYIWGYFKEWCCPIFKFPPQIIYICPSSAG